MGSTSRARVMRFFVLNPGQKFSTVEVHEKTQITAAAIRTNISSFLKIGLIKSSTRSGKKFYTVNESFVYYQELRNLFVKSNVYPQCSQIKSIKSVGKVKLVMVSGAFMNYPQAEIDMLIVANDVKRPALLDVVASIEAEIGHEIRYMILTAQEFEYRLEMMDRFLIEFFTAPHDTIISRIPKLSQFIAEMRR